MANGMKVYFATDHSGLKMKNTLLFYVRDELGHEVEDCGAHVYEDQDDYPDYIKKAAQKVADAPAQHKAIVLGASGQGEAMVANRFPGVRATVFYGEPTAKQTDMNGNKLSIIAGSRSHNDANVLAIGARFVTIEVAKEAVAEWLSIAFNEEERHVRRIKKIDGA